jgi:glycerophosphoryl diester phosphodiesterase
MSATAKSLLSPQSTTPIHINAAARWSLAAKNKVFLFLGHYCTVYDTATFRMDSGFPKKLGDVFSQLHPDFAQGIDAAINWGNGKAYFFKDTRYVRIDVNTRTQDSGYPRAIKGNWPNLSFTGLDAALDWGGGKVYFFKDTQYVRYSKAAPGVPEGQDPGYPKPIKGAWANLSFDSVDAAVDWGDGSTFYFFKADKYARYIRAPEGQLSGYPKSIKGNWVTGCLVIAHHGAQRDAPENTCESIAEAFARGSDIVEIDAQLSKDHIPILMHDATLLKTAGTNKRPDELTLEELQKLDVGSWQNVIPPVAAYATRNWIGTSYGPYLANPRFKGARIPTLGEALLAAQNQGIIWIDAKAPGAANIHAQAIRANDPTMTKYPVYIELTAQSDIPGYTSLFPAIRPVGWQLLWWVYKTTNLPTLTLTDPSDAELKSWRDSGILGLDFDYQVNKSTPPAAVARVKKNGFLVFMYNVNDDSGDHEQEAIDLGIDGVITDDPNKMSLLGVSLKEAGAQTALHQP